MKYMVRSILALLVAMMFCDAEVYSQSFSVESSRVEGTARLGDYPQLKSLVTNLTSSRLHLRISKKEDMPPEWKAQMCFFQSCLGFNVFEKTDSMEADVSEELEIGFFDLNSPGIGEVAVKIENLDDVSDTVTVHFVLTVVDTTTTVRAPAVHNLILHPNYPNPFCRSTSITYELFRPMPVSLIVTDALGREVTRLTAKAGRRAGKHSVSFDASELQSGVYLYRLEAEDVVLVKKMVLMK